MKSSPETIAIIGAGLAGLTLARHLIASGHSTVLFDKGRRPGGRLASRLADGWQFNHGAQFFTRRNPDFARLTGQFNAAAWPAAGPERFIATPNMAALPLALAATLPSVATSTHVTAIAHHGSLWHLDFKDAAPQSFKTLILAIPAPQAAALLAPCAHRLAASLAPVTMAPCWTLMLGFDHEPPGPDSARPEHGPLSWIARESSRPGHTPQKPAFTVQASAAWSRAHLEDPPDSITAALRPAFTAATGITATPSYIATHRWRYALAETPLGAPFLWDDATRLGLCGDWCLAGRLEAAFLSASALGIHLSHDH